MVPVRLLLKGVLMADQDSVSEKGSAGGLALFMVIAGAVLLAIGLFGLIVNFGELLVLTALAPIVIGLGSIGAGLARIRTQRKPR